VNEYFFFVAVFAKKQAACPVVAQGASNPMQYHKGIATSRAIRQPGNIPGKGINIHVSALVPMQGG
jgi:hypothetical protein